jgi:hypothetical protein
MKTNKSFEALRLTARLLGSAVGYTLADYERVKHNGRNYITVLYEGHSTRARWGLAAFFRAVKHVQMEPAAVKQLALCARVGYLSEMETNNEH